MIETSRPPARPSQKNFFYVMLMLGSGAVFGCVGGIFLFMVVTGSFINPADLVGFAPPVEPAAIEVSDSLLLLDDTPTLIQATPLPVNSAEAVPQLPPQLFRIDPARSEASFAVYETFPEGTAVGRTREIAGDIIVDFNTPANSQIGIIRINLRALRTNDSQRDQSIRCCVLLTARDEYEFAEFTPTAISQLPPQVAFEQPVTFQLTGDLALRGVSRPVTFDVELTLIDAEQLEGVATTTVNRRDFGILNNDDNAFDYHGVANEVTLTFEFEAAAVPE